MGAVLSENKNSFSKPLSNFVETERIRLIERVEEQRKQLLSVETKDLRLREHYGEGSEEEFSCDFEGTCYAAKSNMGKCPCELRSTK